MEISIPEEMPVGSRIGEVECLDEDVGENAYVDYHLVCTFANLSKILKETLFRRSFLWFYIYARVENFPLL